MSSVRLPKILPYGKLITFIKSIDVGNVNDFKDFSYNLDTDEVVEGSYRELQPFLLQLADMYVCIADKTSPFLCHFGSEPYHLRVALDDDGAPFCKDEGTSWLVLFLNVGQQIASETENFILAGANCSKSHISMQRYA